MVTQTQDASWEYDAALSQEPDAADEVWGRAISTNSDFAHLEFRGGK